MRGLSGGANRGSTHMANEADARRGFRTGKEEKRNFSLLRGRKRAEKEDGLDYYDYNLMAVVVLLTCFGLVMLYSTSAYEASVTFQNDMHYFEKQSLISIAAFFLMLIFSKIDYHIYARYAWPLFIVSNILLIATRFIGRTINGARRWIYIGSISFQPAELAKVAIILFLPMLIVKAGFRFKKFKVPAQIGALGAGTAVLTYLFTENLSTAVIILGITYILIVVAHPNPGKLLRLTAIVIVAGLILVQILRVTGVMDSMTQSGSFRIQRIATWLHPEENQDKGGYQVMQGLYAIGSGGIFGKGLGNSAQKLGALPEAQNDMIFSIICEELGILGAMIVVLLFVFLLWRLFFIATNAPDLLGSLIATGIFAHISLQVVLNIAVVLNVIPTTGITLPFVSYGGTSILFLMTEMMLALSISGQIRMKK